MTALQFGVEIPFVEHLGFDLVRMEDGQSQIDFEPRREHLNSFDVAHGGVVMTLLDVSMAMAARSLEPDMGVVTIEMKTSFMQPSRGPLQALGGLMHRTATMAFTEARIVDRAGRTCAHATGTFKYVKRLPIGPRGAQAPAISTD